ncbi:MAG: hypothetical protein V9G20_18615 [Candidatus Promineifilaceae bacterium]
MGSVKVAGEANLVTNFLAGGVYPGVRGMGQHLTPDERGDATRLQQRYLFGVA